MIHSISKRFFASFIANILRGGISFFTGLILARWMGPVDYGRMAFLLASFMAYRQVLDMASSSAFFTFLSQRTRSKRFVAFYGRWIALQFMLSVAIIGLILPHSWIINIWKDNSRLLILLAFIASFFQNTVWPITSQMAEAQRETVRVQRLNTMIVMIHLGVVLILWFAGQLAIPLIFISLAIEWGIGGFFAAGLYRGLNDKIGNNSEPEDTPRSVFREFWNYCLPFVPYTLLSFAHDFGDRWMLQNWGGSSEQSYYSIGYQFASVALLATASILRIFWKEIAEAHHRKDYSQMEKLYNKASSALYFSGAVIAGALMPWSLEIIRLMLGNEYTAGSITLMMMFLYPVHQSMGQIGGTMLMAAGQTRIYVVLGMIQMGLSIVTAYILMAPPQAPIPGLALASQGLAYKMVLMQFLSVNVQAWFIAKKFNWKYNWSYQIIGLGIAVPLGWLIKTAIFFIFTIPDFLLMAISIPIYLIVMAIVFYALPSIAGFERKEINTILKTIIRRITLLFQRV